MDAARNSEAVRYFELSKSRSLEASELVDGAFLARPNRDTRTSGERSNGGPKTIRASWLGSGKIIICFPMSMLVGSAQAARPKPVQRERRSHRGAPIECDLCSSALGLELRVGRWMSIIITRLSRVVRRLEWPETNVGRIIRLTCRLRNEPDGNRAPTASLVAQCTSYFGR